MDKKNQNIKNQFTNFLISNNYDEYKQYFFKDNEIELKKIMNTDELFKFCYFAEMEFISYSQKENIIILKNKKGTYLATTNRYYNIKEVFGFDSYSIPQLYEFDDFVVFDIGMNRGYTTLRFAEYENCLKVYGFEIDKITYDKAVYNKNLNSQLQNKIKLFNFGLSDKNNIETLYYLKGADTLSTLEKKFVKIEPQLKIAKENIKTKHVNVRKTSEVIKNILEKDKITSKVILKIDTEGSEYKIINDLIETNLINKIDVILGEGHKFIEENFCDKLKSKGFELVKYKDFDIVYTFAFVKKEYCNIWLLKD